VVFSRPLSPARRRALPFLVAGVVVGTIVLIGTQHLFPSPEFRLVCSPVDSEPAALTYQVASAEHLEPGTTFTIEYGDGSHEGTIGRSRASLRHTYPAHGTYEVRAQVHLPSNRLQDYANSCRV
jgi:hypothetical protein